MRTPVAILGATGMVGQVFVRMLAEHPWFEPAELVASPELAGRAYGEAVSWQGPGPIPEALADAPLVASPDRLTSPVAFSALGDGPASELEARYADAGTWVFSNARTHRMAPGVPLVVPEVNGEHLALAAEQPRPGALVTNPNCSTIGLTLALAALRPFGLRRASVVSLQARSGAGLVDGRVLELEGDVVPHIGGEEGKLTDETRKILGRLTDGLRLEPAPLLVSATCNRVPVVHGHSLCVSVELEREVDVDEALAAWRDFRARPQELDLPSAPARPVHLVDEPDGPRPGRDLARLEHGMAVAVGRVRTEPLFQTDGRGGLRFVTLSHNLIRGAAGGSLLNAELCRATGLLPGR